MTEILFYHLQQQPLETVLPNLVERSLERNWRAAIQASGEERLQALDDHLWTYRDDSFLPHGTDRDPQAASQPVVLTLQDGNPNAAAIRFLVDGAPLPPDASTISGYASCSTVMIRTRCSVRGRSGSRRRKRAMPSLIGSRTNPDAGRKKRERFGPSL